MSWNISRGVAAAAILAGLTIGAGAQAQELSMVESMTDWSVYVDQNPKVCFIVSQPTKSVARRGGQDVTVNRGDIRFHISVIPGQGVAGEPSFMAGYPLKPDEAAKMEVGGTKFELYTDAAVHKEYAWTAPADDTRLIAAMRKGADATVTGVSARGTTTIDTFSLRGFTAAVEKAEELCK